MKGWKLKTGCVGSHAISVGCWSEGLPGEVRFAGEEQPSNEAEKRRTERAKLRVLSRHQG